MKSNNKTNSFFEKAAAKATHATGSTPAIILAFILVLAWLFCGPLFHYSQKWQMIINTGTTTITFLMVFLIQKSQNKDSLAIQLKLNELVAAHEFASNRLVNVEDMTEEELKVIQKYYSKLSDFARKEDENPQQSHSIDETHELHDLKNEMQNELDESAGK
jgi:low affinity Fe/Cu permease